jgi:antitoxin component YwqK of YwqJK toxin-antitoxin module
MPNGQGPVLRLDDAWTVVAHVTGAGVQRVPVATPSLTAFGRLEARSRSVWVAPPPKYSGRWVTYFASGNVNHDIEYAAGQYVRFTSHFDNGQEAYTQRYVGGVIDGVELGYHPDGSKAYAIEHARGASVGTWTHWYPGGQKQSEQTYVAGKLDGVHTGWRADGSKDYEIHYKAGVETGQAAWDEHGTLLYAHGSAKTP